VVDVLAVVWQAGMRVCWHAGGQLVWVWVGKFAWVRNLSSVVWWLAGSVCWLFGVTSLAFGGCCWELLIVGVDGWLLVEWVWLALGRFAVSHGGGGGGGGGVGRWWCGGGACLSMVMNGGVPYFPV
jgi:hypothetical protein